MSSIVLAPHGTTSLHLPPSAPSVLILLSRVASHSSRPLARSYDGNAWENVAPEHLDLSGCGVSCTFHLPRIDGQYKLEWRNASVPTSEEYAARFLMQASFGPTQSTIDSLAATNVSAWIDEQRQLSPTLHRAHFRRHASPRNNAAVGTGGVRRACEAGTRKHARRKPARR